MAIPGILHYRHHIIPALVDAGVDVGATSGSLIVEPGLIDYVAMVRCDGRTRFERVVRRIDTDDILARWGLDAGIRVVLFPTGIAQAVVTVGEQVQGWILIDMSDIDVSMSC